MADNITPNQQSPEASDSQRRAAADVIKNDIDRIFDGDDAPLKEIEQELTASAAQPTSEPENHQDPGPTASTDPSNQWQKYHTSWQSYYQQYYERYYLNHVHQLKTAGTQTAGSTPGEAIGSHPSDPLEQESTMSELRDQLLANVKERAGTVRKSRHFAPIATALVFALVFSFLQYNRFFFATVEAYVSPGSADPQNIIVDPNSSLAVGSDPKLIIPKINVEAPVVYGVNSSNLAAVENNLHDGVVHYPIPGASSVPGQNGPTVILGHSSNDVFDNGKYKFVFVQLSKLEKGDTFYINYKAKRYTYSVRKKTIIKPTEINKVASDPNKPSAILITCDPPGTALNRLLVFADQISPDPTKATKPTNNPNAKSTQIAGNSPTFLENLFGDR